MKLNLYQYFQDNPVGGTGIYPDSNEIQKVALEIGNHPLIM